MRPLAAGDGYALYQSECEPLLPLLPEACVDALITDPPYSSGGMTAGERAADPALKYCQNGHTCGRPTFTGDNKDQRSFGYWCQLWLSQCRRLVRPGGYAMLFTDWRQLPTVTDALQAAGFVWRGVVVWNKGRGARAPHKGYFRHQAEYVVWGTNGRVPKATHAGPFDGVIDCKVRRADKHHMTGKPTDLMRRLVSVVPSGSLILDSFAGSATTGVACALEGRRFIGFEPSADYCRIGAKRIEAATRGEILPAA